MCLLRFVCLSITSVTQEVMNEFSRKFWNGRAPEDIHILLVFGVDLLLELDPQFFVKFVLNCKIGHMRCVIV